MAAASSGWSFSGALKLVGARCWESKVDESEIYKASSTVGDTVEGSCLAARKGLVVMAMDSRSSVLLGWFDRQMSILDF